MIKMEYLIELSVRGVAQWLARLLWEQDVAGSTPATPTIFFAQNLDIKLCSNNLIYLPKFANLDFLENTTPDATLKNVILRF